MPDIRQQIIARMKAAGVRQCDLAPKAGLRPQNLNAYLRGRRQLRADTVERVAAALGMELQIVDTAGVTDGGKNS